jgi:uncharacterized protein
MVENKAAVVEQLTKHAARLAALGVSRYGLFGSFRHDTPQATSDVDILVEFHPGAKTFVNFMRVAALLEEVFGRPIDVVTSESLSPYLAPMILREVEYAALGS